MKTQNYSDNKRIAKNTLLLYFRMIFIMAIQLFTSRVVLNTLGIDDYGIYNVVGGVVAMFGFLNKAMTTSTQRYLTFELGKGDFDQLRRVFSTSICIHLLISVVVVLLAETVGLWFLLEKMIIPESRMNAAMWVYQLSVFTTVVAIMSFPYNAAIIAHEKMSAFAYISVAEVVLKLAVVYLLTLASVDKLVLYAILICLIQILIRVVYSMYCTRHFAETKCGFIKDKALFKEMFSFAGWNLWGHAASIMFSQGLNILLNLFFGPTVNAARAIAVQVESAIHQFSNNFQMALNPQITKTYAAGQIKEMHKLVFRSSKFTFCLLLVLCMPVMLEAPFILKIWLKTVPDYTHIFLRIILVTVIIDSSANSLMVSAAATGRIKKYQSVIGGILLTIVPISYLVLKLGATPWSVFVVHLIICCVAYATRLAIIRPMINLVISNYFKEVILRCILVAIVSSVLPIAIKMIADDFAGKSIVVIAVCITYSSVCCLFLGFDSHERNVVLSKIKDKLVRK